ncbi:Asp-tRNA(Asn)/Glu-tRNA(Gln) amidotransferase subunit GatB [Streptomyces sp. NPDC052644]
MTTTLPAYDEVVARYEPVIGLETHVELGTNTKMFCGCPTDFGGEPNTRVCPVCLGLPGSLPVANRAAIEATIRIGLALNCSIAQWCRFARKNYFYPDMPKDFQISQYDEPLCSDGYLDVEVDGELVRIGIERVHLEEDTGKTLHVGGATGRIHGATESLVDYNRAGIPLVEIVTKPVPGTGALAPDTAWVAELKAALPELPRLHRRRLQEQWGLSDLDMQSVLNAGAVELIEATVASGTTPAAARKWWLGELSRRANETGTELADIGATPAQVAELQGLVDAGKLNDKLARTVLEGVVAGEGSPTEIMTNRGLEVVSDTGALTAAVDEAIAANPGIADKIRSGKVAAAGALVGAVMKATRGQADAKTVRDLVLERLGVQG